MLTTGKRNRLIRETALQILFAWDSLGDADDATARQVAGDQPEFDDPSLAEQAIAYARGAWDQREMIDQRLERFAPQWPPRRQPGVDRNVLRLAVWELTNLPTSPAIVLNDAIEIARAYSTQNSAAFVNAVLDAILKEHQALVAGLAPVEAPAPIPAPDIATAPQPTPSADA